MAHFLIRFQWFTVDRPQYPDPRKSPFFHGTRIKTTDRTTGWISSLVIGWCIRIYSAWGLKETLCLI